MADCVDAAVNRVKPALCEAHPDRATPEPERDQLAAGDNAMLAGRQNRDSSVERTLPWLCIHVVHEDGEGPGSPRLAASGRLA